MLVFFFLLFDEISHKKQLTKGRVHSGLKSDKPESTVVRKLRWQEER